jgi:hypothetical protein
MGIGGLISTGLAAMLVAITAHAADPLTQAQALDLITTTADKICNVVSTRGESQSSEAKGDIKVQLTGLASKLVDVGVSGAGAFKSEEYQNVLREQLAGTLANNASCKLQVFDSLQAKLLTASSP